VSDIFSRERAMRINARLDDEAQQQIDYLVQVTGQSVSHVVREAVARYHAQTKAQQGGPRRLLAMVGQGDSGRSDIASRYKALLAESLSQKHGVGPASPAGPAGPAAQATPRGPHDRG